MAMDRLLSFILRLAEIAFGAIVVGITGEYLHNANSTGTDSWGLGRFIYTEVVAALSIFLAILWLFPFSGSFIHWPVDFLLSVCWFVAFGLMVNLVGNTCGYIFNWDNVSPGGDPCGKFKADIAFAFLSAICWLASALIGLFWVRGHTTVAPDAAPAYRRRRWYRSRV